MSAQARLVALGLGGLVTVVAGFEGLRQYAYLDPVGIPTICFGSTRGVRIGQHKTLEECKNLLAEELLVARGSVHACVDVPMSKNEDKAYTSFTYNVGGGAFCKSTLVKNLNAGDRAGACAQLSRWVYATKMGVKIELPGLVNRRAEERNICETPDE